MEIEFVDFESDIFKNAVSKKPSIYLADNESTANLKFAQKEYEKIKKPLMKPSLFYSWNEIKEILFPVKEIILREEKLSVVLYEILSKKEKEILEINNYNDIIDFSARFHNFYRELNEYQIKELPELKGWQKKRFELLQNIREKYLNYLERKSYTDVSLVRKEANFSPEKIKEFERLVLLNTVYLTPLEKNILHKLNQFIDVEIYLQLSPEDFSEKDLNFKGLSLPDFWPGKLELFTAEEEELQLASAIALAEKDKSLLLSPLLEKTDYQRIIPAERVEMSREEKFSHCKIYKFINSLYLLLNSSTDNKNNVVGLPELFSQTCHSFFRKYFDLSQGIIIQLKELVQDNYLYLTREMAEKNIPELSSVFTELEKLRNISDLSDLVSYMDKITLEKLEDTNWENDLSQFYDGLMELSALENMNLVSSWEKYYKIPATGLLDRLLQYLEYKKIQPVLPEKKPDLKLESLTFAPHVSRNQVVVFNARQGWLPAGEEQNFLLTEVQRREAGLPTSREVRKIQRYYFLRHLLTSKKADIISLENNEENESPGAFMEELKLKYNLEFKEAPVNRSHYVNLYQGIFNNEINRKIETSPFSPEENNEVYQEEDPLIEREDFPGSRFYLSYYKFDTLKKCYFKFYCERLMKLEEELGEIEKRLKPLTFGNIVHNLTEKMLKSVTIDQFNLKKAEINNLINETLAEFSLKIDHRFEYYYNKIVKDELISSMQEFMYELTDIFSYHNIHPEGLRVEYTPGEGSNNSFFSSEIVDYYLSGRIDLYIQGRNNNLIVDFKSGGMNEDQLNFYALLLNQVEGNSKPVYKYIYQVLDRNFVPVAPGSEKEFRDDLKKELEKFSKNDRFIKNYSYRCNNCNYKKICRVVSNL